MWLRTTNVCWGSCGWLTTSTSRSRGRSGSCRRSRRADLRWRRVRDGSVRRRMRHLRRHVIVVSAMFPLLIAGRLILRLRLRTRPNMRAVYRSRWIEIMLGWRWLNATILCVANTWGKPWTRRVRRDGVIRASAKIAMRLLNHVRANRLRS